MNNTGEFMHVVKIILIVVSLVALVLVVDTWAAWRKEAGPAEYCRLGILLKSSTRFCQTERHMVPYDDEYSINKDLADQLVKCWWQSLEGEADIKKFQLIGTSARTDKPFCAICSINSFDEPAKRKYTNTGIHTFPSFLQTEQLPGTKKTYLEYLTKNPDAAQFHVDAEGLQYALNVNQRYAIVIAQGDATSLERIVTGIGAGAGSGAAIAIFTGPGVIIGAVVGGILGGITAFNLPDQTHTTLLFVPYDESLGQQCAGIG